MSVATFRTGDCIRGQQDTYVCDLLSPHPLTILVERWAACPGLLPGVVSIERSCDIGDIDLMSLFLCVIIMSETSEAMFVDIFTDRVEIHVQMSLSLS